MKEFYCNKCEEDVELVKGKCPKCGTNWQKVIAESLSNEAEAANYIDSVVENNLDSMKPYEETNDIEDTCDFFLKYAVIGKLLCFIGAGLLLVMAILVAAEDLVYTFVFLFLGAFAIFYGIFFERNMKWKSYMLQTNYKKTKMKK